MVIARGVDDILIAPSNEAIMKEYKLKNYLKSINLPLVMIDRYYDDLDCNKVYFYNEYGTQQAVSLLVEHGHHNIGCIAGNNTSKNASSRLKGYISAMKNHGIDVKSAYIYDGYYKFDGGYQVGLHIIKSDISAV